MKIYTEPKVWIAHSDCDKEKVTILSEGLDRQLIYIGNDYVEYKIRQGSDIKDVITESISNADIVLAFISNKTNPEDIISQLKRANTYSKKVLVVLDGDSTDISPNLSNIEMAEMISGKPHIYWSIKRTFIDLIGLIKGTEVANSQAIKNDKLKCDNFSVFISKKSEDFELAEKVYNHLINNKITVFLSEKSLPALGSAEYMKAIDNALELAKHLIVVGSKAEYFLSGWVEAEWRVFINEKRSSRKKGNIITIIPEGLDINELPMSLRYYEVIPLNKAGLDNLKNYVID